MGYHMRSPDVPIRCTKYGMSQTVIIPFAEFRIRGPTTYGIYSSTYIQCTHINCNTLKP